MDSGTTTTSGTPQRNRFLANSLLLHLRPARVPLRAIWSTHTFGPGGWWPGTASLVSLGVLATVEAVWIAVDKLGSRCGAAEANEGGIVHVGTSKRIRRSSLDPAQVVGEGESA